MQESAHVQWHRMAIVLGMKKGKTTVDVAGAGLGKPIKVWRGRIRLPA